MDPRDFFSQFASQFGGMFNEGGMPGMGRRAQRGGDIDVRSAARHILIHTLSFSTFAW
jgi:hypothetical protein